MAETEISRGIVVGGGTTIFNNLLYRNGTGIES
jgi:hypothetical protein